MVRFLLVTVAVLAWLEVYPQGKLSFGLMVSPSIEQYTNRAFVPTYDVRGYDDKLSYNFGLKSRLTFPNHLSVSSGLLVYNKGMKYTVHTTPNAILTYHLWFLSIPLTLDYQLRLTNKVAFSSSIGGLYGKPVHEYYYQEYKDRRFYTNIGRWVKASYVGATASLGFTYQIAQRVSLEMRPTYVRQLKLGWGKNGKFRYDSYLFEVVTWYDFRVKHNRQQPLKNRRFVTV